jgi:Ribonuclease G/E
VSEVEVFLDETPGETRGVIARDGRFQHLLMDRDDDVLAHRLGAGSVGRVAEVAAGLKGAFVDLGTGVFGFLPLRGGQTLAVGEKVEVEVTAEPRERKGPTLRRIGPGEGAPRRLRSGPTVRESLARLAPGTATVTGIEAIQAGQDAEEEASRAGQIFPETGLDLMVERTRALIAVDLDLAPGAGMATGAKARDRANRQGLRAAARLIGLKRWGGLAAIDLIGVGHDGDAILAAARQAFGADPEIVYGPINRFGVLQLSLPWRRTPLEELFQGPDGRRRVEHRAQDVVRGLRRALLSDTAAPRVTARCAPDEAVLAAPLAARLGPRALVRPDPALAPGAFVLDME